MRKSVIALMGFAGLVLVVTSFSFSTAPLQSLPLPALVPDSARSATAPVPAARAQKPASPVSVWKAVEPQAAFNDLLQRVAERIDAELVPIAKEQAASVKGYAAPQLIMLDLSPAFVVIAENLVASLDRLGLVGRLLIVSVGKCVDGTTTVCEKMKGGRCVDVTWLYEEMVQLVRKPSHNRPSHDWKDIESFVLLRFAILWRLTAQGVGTTLLDGDLSVLKDFYTLDWRPERFSFVTALDYGHCGTIWHHLAGWSAQPGWCATPIPPLIIQPEATGYMHNIIAKYMEEATPDNILRPITNPLQGFEVTLEGPEHFELKEKEGGRIQIAALRCNTSISFCNSPQGRSSFAQCVPSTFDRMVSYHSNCVWPESIRTKVGHLISQKAWFVKQPDESCFPTKL
jgi:hypothetical protein